VNGLQVTKDFGIFRKQQEEEEEDQSKKNPLEDDIKKTTSLIYSNLAGKYMYTHSINTYVTSY